MMESITIRIFKVKHMSGDFGISGKKYLVTGASSGIGRAAAINISQFGGKVILSGRNEERLVETLSQMTGQGHRIMPFDLVELEKIKEYVKDCVNADGKLFDGMVFSAGVVNPTPIRAETVDNINCMMTINYYSYVTLLKEFSSKKVMKDNGSIVAVSSGAACGPIKGQMSYASSKSSLDISSEVAAQEFVKRKIRVNTVRPHMTVSPMTAYYFDNPEIQEKLEDLFPLGVLTPNDIADSIIFLLSNMSSKITGQHIYLSAGNFSNAM